MSWDNLQMYISPLFSSSFFFKGWGVGSGGFSSGSIPKAGEGWIKSSLGMARYETMCIAVLC